MKQFLKKIWETLGIGLITVAVVGLVGWWGSYRGTTVTISHLCDDVHELSQSVKKLTTGLLQTEVSMAIIKTQLDEAKEVRSLQNQEIAEIKKDVKRTGQTLDRHMLENHRVGK